MAFRLDPSGRQTVLHTFTGGLDGGHPFAGMVMDPAGNLYGQHLWAAPAAAIAAVTASCTKSTPLASTRFFYNFTGLTRITKQLSIMTTPRRPIVRLRSTMERSTMRLERSTRRPTSNTLVRHTKPRRRPTKNPDNRSSLQLEFNKPPV